MSLIKTGSRINTWLIDPDFAASSSGLSKANHEHFKRVCERIYTGYFITCPIPLYISWDKVKKRFYFSVGNKFCLMPYNSNISEYDYPELLQKWSYRLYPGYTIEVEKERSPTPEEVANMVLAGIPEDEAFNRVVVEKKKQVCVVEKIVVKDDQITVNVNGKRYIALSRPDKPISQFISNFRKIPDPYHKKSFLNEYTKNILEVTYLKNIDVKLDTNFIENFFKIRVASNYNFPLVKQDEEGYVYKWGRFTIFFARHDEVDKAKSIISSFRKNFKSEENEDAYIKREFGLVFGVKEI